MMIPGKREGRNAVIFTILVVQTLFMIKGAEATTIIVSTSSPSPSMSSSSSPSSVSSSVSPTTSSPSTSTSQSSSAPSISKSVSPTTTSVSTSATTQSSSSLSKSVASTSSSPESTTVLPSSTPSTTSQTSDITTAMQTSSPAPSVTNTVAAPATLSPTSSAPLPSSSAPPIGTPAPQGKTDEVDVYIKMTFAMPWGRLCFLRGLFKQALSDDLLEFIPLQHQTLELLTYKNVEPDRIKMMNVQEKCLNRSFYNDEAVLNFYISNRTGFNYTDTNMTIKAFKKLHGYWVNNQMVLLDKVFERKVKKVELMGADQEKYVDEYTEAQRIGIGIGVGMAVVVLIILIYFCVKGFRNVKSVGLSPEDKRMIFTNTVALDEDAGNAGDASEPRSDEPQEIVIHTQPLASDERPLLSDETDAGRAPLAKPEPDNVSEGEPIKPPDEFKGEPDKPPAEPEGEPEEKPEGVPEEKPEGKPENEPEGEPMKPSDEPETVVAPDEAPQASEPPDTEEPPERRDTFTSPVTIVITPTSSSPTTFEFPVEDNPPEPAKESDDVKPDFSQSDNVDGDTTQGAINLAFDVKGEEQADQKDKEAEEETKF